jgi:glutathione S-transferase
LYAISEQNIEASAAIHAHFNGAQYAPNRTEAMDALFSEGSRLQKTLAGIEKTFEEGSVFVGSEATVGDYFLAAGLMQAALLQPDSLDAYPKCKALHDHVHTMDGAKAYLATVPYSYFKRNSD